MPDPSLENRPSDSRQQKRTRQIVDITVPADHGVKLNKNETRDKNVDVAGELKKMEYESDGDTNCNCRTRYSQQKFDIGTERNREGFWRPEETYYHSNSCGRPSANAGAKNS